MLPWRFLVDRRVSTSQCQQPLFGLASGRQVMIFSGLFGWLCRFGTAAKIPSSLTKLRHTTTNPIAPISTIFFRASTDADAGRRAIGRGEDGGARAGGTG